MFATVEALSETVDPVYGKAALQEVASFEGGTVINEHYNLEDYVKHRGHFLSKLREFRNRNSCLFRMAREDADMIFNSKSDQMSVQEVRRRELQHEVDPLLPYPTTGNTLTIDNFQNYPSIEWHPEMSVIATQPEDAIHKLRVVPRSLPTTSDSTHSTANAAGGTIVANLDRDTNLANSHADPVSTSSISISDPATIPSSPTVAPQGRPLKLQLKHPHKRNSSHSEPVVVSEGFSGFMKGPKSLSANTAQSVPSEEQTTATQNVSLPSPPPSFPNLTRPANTMSESNVASAGPQPQSGNPGVIAQSDSPIAPYIPGSPRLIRKIIDHLGNPPKDPTVATENSADEFNGADTSQSTQMASNGERIESMEDPSNSTMDAQPSGDQGAGGGTPQTIDMANDDDRLGAMKDRPLKVPVKRQRGTKQATSPAGSDATTSEAGAFSEEEDDSDDEVAAPPAKMPRRSNSSTAASAAAEAVREEAQEAVDHEASMKSANLANGVEKIPSPKKKSKKKASPLTKGPSSKKASNNSSRQPNPRQLDAIVAGTGLPETDEIAKQAARIRYQRLLAKHNQETGASLAVSARAPSSSDPDFMPEFFNKDSFTEFSNEYGCTEVRCPGIGCGKVANDPNDPEEMLQCEKCEVWQHTVCMGNAVPEDKANDKYLCHMCDPFAHRVLIEKLRRNKKLSG